MPRNTCKNISSFCLLTSSFKKWWGATVPPRALRFKRPLHRCNAYNPNANAKAELNRRSQVCEILTGTSVRVAKIGLPSRSLGEGWSSIRVARPVFRFGRCLHTATMRVSLNTYARWNPVLELHQPLRFCKPPPELLGQRDLKLKARAEIFISVRVD